MQESKKIIEDANNVDILIITALQEEYDAFLALFESRQLIRIGEINIGILTRIETTAGDSYKIVITTMSTMGNVEAGIHSTQVISQINPSYVLMAGIAGGIIDRVNKGDILVADQIIYYASAKRTSKGNIIRPISIPTDTHLLQVAKTLNQTNWESLIIETRPSETEFSVQKPAIHIGPILVGEEVVADQAYIQELTKLHPKAIGIEMESFGIGRAANSSIQRPRFISIRCVSDLADSSKDDDWHPYACSAVAAFTYSLISSCLIKRQDHSTKKSSCNLLAICHFSQQAMPEDSITSSLVVGNQDKQISKIIIDQRNFFSNGYPKVTNEIIESQRSLGSTIDKILLEQPDLILGYFGIAHIPLLFHLGHCITNKRKLTYYEFDRYKSEWIPLHKDGESVDMVVEGMPTNRIMDERDILFRISVSNSILLDDVNPIVQNPICSPHLRLRQPARDSIINQVQLFDLGKTFRASLDAIHEYIPNRKATHIFYAGPVSLAVYLGQLVHYGVDREIVIYNYSPSHSPRYSWGLDITGHEFRFNV